MYMIEQHGFDARHREALVSGRGRADFQLLQDSSVFHVPERERIESITADLVEVGYEQFRIDASCWRDDADVYDAFDDAFRFPPGGGRNLDALRDWLRDMAEFEFVSSTAATGTVVVITSFDTFRLRSPSLAVDVAGLLVETCRYALVVRHLMLVLLEGTGPVDHGSSPWSRLPVR